MILNLLESDRRFIVSSARPDAPLMLPPIMFGDIEPIQLRVFRRAGNGSLVAVSNLDDYDITLQLGTPNTRPALGFWQLVTTGGTSPAISARATAAEIEEALRGVFGGGVTVDGRNGSYVVTLNGNGIWALPSATFQGNTLSNVLVFQITPGTATTPAQYRIEVLEVAPARIIPANWDIGDTFVANAFTQVNGKLWHLTLDARADNGFFTLTVDAATTDFISFSADAYQIGLALTVAGKSAQVQDDGIGGFWVLFTALPGAVAAGGNLVILPYETGSLDLRSTGLRELLDGLQWADVKLTVILAIDGQIVTVASADVVLQMPVNQPAVIFIDAPAMAGMTFAISADGSALEVFRNGVQIGQIALNAPVADVPQAGGISFAALDDGSGIDVFQSGDPVGSAALNA